MAITSKLTAIGIIALSLTIGFLSFYLLRDLPKEEKKKHLEELTSQLINFVLFIWLGKIILNISIFISDPLSVLAYPSDSKAFYLATVLLSFLLVYKTKRKNLEVLPILESFVHVFLISSFVYEFIQLVIEENRYALGYLVLLALLIGLFFFLTERFTVPILLIIITSIWSVGMLVLLYVQPFVTVFGYMMTPWFVMLFSITSVGSLTYKIRGRDT
ncbi:hypothetical protein [Ornithinibacillus halotolerans]|uniref:Uncharacterized protein n=1 Tax=Ornithinibacillus halotolerans TaxID=1274357 RepID=A0A916RXR0_9BACI|nr:hypothetical protein [Ornithinibacillus halotolerans]GGA71966.1 hypothetical protein GCM10008025_14740 [Ornithinibacillus halotolerans]